MQPLQPPLVACELGNIFNKEALLTALLDRGLPEDLAHIRGLKDVKTLEFCTSISDEGQTIRICPVTQDVFNGAHPFVVIWTTGKVLSEKAIREIGIEGLQAEYGPFTALDVINLIPLEQDMDTVRAAMHRRKEARRTGKKSKASAVATVTTTDALAVADSILEEKKTSKKRNISEVHGTEYVNSRTVSSKSTNNLVQKAIGSVTESSNQSHVFKGLFHKDGEKDKTGSDLFMTVAGLRYTVS